MKHWRSGLVQFKFQISDWTFFSVSIPLQTRRVGLVDQVAPVAVPVPPSDPLLESDQGFGIRRLPVVAELPVISRVGGYLCYIPLQYQICYVDLRMTFDEYKKTFSSKTRSTIKRKVSRYAQHCGGTIRWSTYKAPSEMREFIQLARIVSMKTYQERLLDVGIPGSEAFIKQTENLAANDQVRGYLLFEGDRPVSYLYCPAEDGVLIYAHLGYDPEYSELSVGTVLLWLAIEQMFSETKFQYFDFEEGQGHQKQLFSTHQKRCANVFFVRRSLRNIAVIYGQFGMDRLSKQLGNLLHRMGVKTRLKRLLRFGT